jgi:hypothetical protein
MDIQRWSTYLDMDRNHALGAGRALPDRGEGPVPFAQRRGLRHAVAGRHGRVHKSSEPWAIVAARRAVEAASSPAEVTG